MNILLEDIAKVGHELGKSEGQDSAERRHEDVPPSFEQVQERNFESHFNRVKDNYVKVCRGIIDHLKILSDFENEFVQTVKSPCPESPEDIQNCLDELMPFYESLANKFNSEVVPSLHSVLEIIDQVVIFSFF